MKKKELYFYIAVGVLLICIILIYILKFGPSRRESFEIKNMDHLSVTDLMGNKVKFQDSWKKGETVYCLLFDLNDCFSCIYRGLEDLKYLKNKGKKCLGIVINDYVEEVKGWAAQYECSPVFLLKRIDFFNHIKCVKTPVFFILEKGNVENFRYITAN